MIAACTQMVVGCIALLFCIRGYWQGRVLGSANTRLGLNGSTGMIVRTIKRREVLHGLTCFVVAATGAYVAWLLYHDRQESAQVAVIVRSLGFTVIAFLIVLGTLWDAIDRANIADVRKHEQVRKEAGP